MIIFIIQLFLLFGILFYSISILYLIFIAIHHPRKKIFLDTLHPVPLSIVIPCKNEAENIPFLLASLDEQEYNAKIDIIIVDDGSSDNSYDIIQQLIPEMKIPTRYISSSYKPAIQLTSKQQAIDIGVRAAKYDRIVLTDADMLFSTKWLQSFSDALNSNADLIFGHTAIIPGKNLFSFIQAMLLEFLFSIAAVLHFAKIPGSCMGNNIMIKKSSYLKSGGFNAIGYTITEDRALLHHFHSLKYSISIVTPFYPHAFTQPVFPFSSFKNQIIRWFRGGIGYGGNLLWIVLLFSFQNLSFMLLPFFLLPLLHSSLIVSNFFLTWLLVGILFSKQHAPVSPLIFPFFYIIILVGTIALPVLNLFKKRLSWKGVSL